MTLAPFLLIATLLAAEPQPSEAVAGGRVALSCAIDEATRALSDCKVVSETPPGQGFGEAALKGAANLRPAPDEARIGADGRVRFTIQFDEAQPEPTKGPGPFADSPLWEEAPDADAIEALYPRDAERDGVDGRVTIACEVHKSRKLDACEIVEETPAGHGFGVAAQRLSLFFTARPRALGGPKIGSAVQITIDFNLPEPPPAEALAEAAHCSGVLMTRLREASTPELGRAAGFASSAAEMIAQARKAPAEEVKRLRQAGRDDRSPETFKRCFDRYRGGPAAP